MCVGWGSGGTSSAVQWLRLALPTQGAWVGSLVRELRSHMLYGTAEKNPEIKNGGKPNRGPIPDLLSSGKRGNPLGRPSLRDFRLGGGVGSCKLERKPGPSAWGSGISLVGVPR